MTRHDVVIIGAGMVGCGAAFHLARGGASVLLVDHGDLNRGASGQNAGSLHFQLEHRLLEHGTERSAEFAQIIPLNLAAIDDWAGLEALLEADLEVVMEGGLMVAESDADIALLETKHALEQRWRLPTSLLSAAETRRRAPYLSSSIRAAGWCAREGHANPRLIAPAYARAAVRAGAEIRTHTAVTAIERGADGWRLQLRAGRAVSGELTVDEVAAGAVVNAAGAWIAEVGALAHLHLPIFPVALQMNVTERAAPFLPHLVQHVNRRLSMKQVRDGNVLIGGGWSARFPRVAGVPDWRARPLPVGEHVRANLAVATDVIPAVAGLQWLRTWTGTVGVAADQMPLLGEVPEAPGYFVAGGGSAFTLGPTYARLLGELILDGESALPIDFYSPARFGHINSFMVTG